MTETIFAPATASGRAAIAVVRISGPLARTLLRSLCGARETPPRRAVLRTVRARDGEVLDQALTLFFPGPGSATGEDLAELHLHGGPAVVERVCRELSDLGARWAEPGEFTRRAFEAGRLDLVQAEAVADLVDAETEAQRRQALANLGGVFSRRAASWRASLVELLALLESQVDFPDEEIPADVVAEWGRALESLRWELDRAAADVRGERVAEGYRVGLFGPPNAGKSSLLNALAGRDAAIVTSVPGTTRDVLEVQLILGGYRVSLFDTAGLRVSEDVVEREGVRRARDLASRVDLRLVLEAADEGSIRAGADPGDDGGGDTQIAATPGVEEVRLVSKADLACRPPTPSDGRMRVSVVTGEGLDGLKRMIEARTVAALASSGGSGFRARHRELIAAAAAHLAAAAAPDLGAVPELAAEEVRQAARCVERLTGRIATEDVLGEVFSRFCIGK